MSLIIDMSISQVSPWPEDLISKVRRALALYFISIITPFYLHLYLLGERSILRGFYILFTWPLGFYISFESLLDSRLSVGLTIYSYRDAIRQVMVLTGLVGGAPVEWDIFLIRLMGFIKGIFMIIYPILIVIAFIHMIYSREPSRNLLLSPLITGIIILVLDVLAVVLYFVAGPILITFPIGLILTLIAGYELFTSFHLEGGEEYVY